MKMIFMYMDRLVFKWQDINYEFNIYLIVLLFLMLVKIRYQFVINRFIDYVDCVVVKFLGILIIEKLFICVNGQ